jgi:3-demethoxyubiquinol 3-hydroxylase
MTRPVPPRPGQGALSSRLAEILRVDQAGELAAVHIYRGQAAVMRNAPGRERIADQLKEMEGHEQVHLSRFNELLTERNVRPTLMSPVWRAAAFALGAGTALLGDKAAHACTEAVETVIEKHYAGQIEDQFRDDELAHRDLAIEEGAHEAAAYPLLTAVIQAGCRAAIKISEKI